jgi:hypothetical protein
MSHEPHAACPPNPNHQPLGSLVEGNSSRSTERMTNTHRDTIMRLMVEVGTGCTKLSDRQMRDLNCRRILCDEIWSFVKVGDEGHNAKTCPSQQPSTE